MAKQQLDEERVNAFRAEINAYIDAVVEREHKRFPGVPPASLRTSLTQGIGCACAAFLEIKAKEAKGMVA